MEPTEQSAGDVGKPSQQGMMVVGQPQMAMMGPCPNCHQGYPMDKFTVCGIVLAILCFPCGLLCCFMMRERRCSVCGTRMNV